MPKINQEEYEVLKKIRKNGYEEIRRNSTGDIAVRSIGEKVTSHQYQTEHNDKFKFLEATGDYWSIAELIAEYEEDYKGSWEHAIEFSKEMRRESEETEVKDIEWLKRSIDKRMKTIESDDITFVGSEYYDEGYIDGMRDALYRINQLDEPEPQNITLQDITHRLWELPLNNRKYWLEQLNDEFQEGYIVPLGLKTTDGEEQYLTLNGSYFASRRNRYLQQTFATLEEIPEFYRDLAERVL